MRKMKDSGIEWIGEIPEDWEVGRVKNIAELISGYAFDSEDLNIEGKNIVIRIGDIKDGSVDIENANKTNFNDEVLSFFQVKNNDVLIAMSGATVGKLGYVNFSPKNTYINQRVGILRSSFSKFLYYALTTNKFIEYILLESIGSAQPNISNDGIKNYPLCIPSFPEQQRIADFLDDKVSQIDSVISKTRETIEEYKKLKQSIITEVVTGKVKIENGKVCGKYDTYKDSGIEWIGEIPSEWEVWKTLYTLKMPITDGPHETPELLPDGIPFISAEAVSCGNGHIDFSHKRGYISREYYNECCKKYVPQMDDIYMIKSGATTGKIAKVETTEIFTIWSPLAVFRFDEHIANVKYMFFYLQSDCYQKQIEDKWTFGTQQNIGMRTLEQLKLILPSLHEQQQISDFLDKKCFEIDKLITKKEQLVVELEAYKKSLIYEVVTGKREV